MKPSAWFHRSFEPHHEGPGLILLGAGSPTHPFVGLWCRCRYRRRLQCASGWVVSGHGSDRARLAALDRPVHTRGNGLCQLGDAGGFGSAHLFAHATIAHWNGSLMTLISIGFIRLMDGVDAYSRQLLQNP